jgi:hypothetical protein
MDPRRRYVTIAAVALVGGLGLGTPGARTQASDSCTPLPSDAVAWWRGEESMEDVFCVNDGTFGGPGYSAGMVGSAFDLDGSSQWVGVPDDDSLDTPDGFTLEGWVFPRTGSHRVIVSKWDDDAGSWSWIIHHKIFDGSFPGLEISNGTNHNGLGTLTAAHALTDNDWNHIAASYDAASGVVKFYVNGSLSVTATLPVTGISVGSSTANLIIGAVNLSRANKEVFDGKIDELTLYSRALTDDEVAAIYDAGADGKCLPEPVIVCPSDLGPFEATGPDGAAVEFDDATATDRCGDALTTTCDATSGDSFPVGETTVTCSATDADLGTSASCSFTITVVDTTPPVIDSVVPSLTTLWPPNNKMRSITLTVDADDLVGVTECKIVGVTSDEAQGKDVDAVVTGDLSLDLRAQRDGKGDGRVYTITVRCKDAAGNATTSTTTVVVPHDQGK